MSDVTIKARNRGDWNQWRLGDSILVCSVLAAIGTEINLHVKSVSSGINLIKSLSDIYGHYKLNVVVTDSTPNIIYPDEYYLRNNVEVITYPKAEVSKHITTQWVSKSSNRSVTNTEYWLDKFGLTGKQVMNMDSAETKYNSLQHVFEIMSESETHIGGPSGMTWLAASCGVPTIALFNHAHRLKHDKWDYAIEAVYRNKLVTFYDVK
jgi:hypothetical protein